MGALYPSRHLRAANGRRPEFTRRTPSAWCSGLEGVGKACQRGKLPGSGVASHFRGLECAGCVPVTRRIFLIQIRSGRPCVRWSRRTGPVVGRRNTPGERSSTRWRTGCGVCFRFVQAAAGHGGHLQGAGNQRAAHAVGDGPARVRWGRPYCAGGCASSRRSAVKRRGRAEQEDSRELIAGGPPRCLDAGQDDLGQGHV